MTIPLPGPSVTPSLSSPQTYNSDYLSFQAWLTGTGNQQLVGWLNNLLAEGSNANGSYLQIAGDYQFCWHKPTITYSNVGFMGDTWVYPSSFSSTPHVGAFLDLSDFASNASADINDLTSVMTGSATSSQAALQLYRAEGSDNFDPADTTEVYAFAFGAI